MKIIGVPSRVGLSLIAAVLLLQLSPALATGQPDAQQATIQGSRFPGMPVPSTDTTRDRRRGPVEVTFTKWVTRECVRPRQLRIHGRAGAHGRVHRRRYSGHLRRGGASRATERERGPENGHQQAGGDL